MNSLHRSTETKSDEENNSIAKEIEREREPMLWCVQSPIYNDSRTRKVSYFLSLLLVPILVRE